jgi:hypothetical protein
VFAERNEHTHSLYQTEYFLARGLNKFWQVLEHLVELSQLAMLQAVEEKHYVVAAVPKSVILNPDSVLLVFARNHMRRRERKRIEIDLVFVADADPMRTADVRRAHIENAVVARLIHVLLEYDLIHLNSHRFG